MKEKISAMSAQVKAILLERFSGAEVGAMADQLDDELQERFGGRKFNGDRAPAGRGTSSFPCSECSIHTCRHAPAG